MSSTAHNLCRRHRLTVDDYYRMAEAGILHEDSRVELIEGDIIDMAPIGSPHAGAVKRLIRLFTKVFGDRVVVSAQDPIRLDECSEPQPDIALLYPRDDFYTSAHPKPEDVLLIIEVAESSLRYDREIKIPLYAKHGIPEAWLIDLENKRLTCFRAPTEAGYQTVLHPERLTAISVQRLPGIELDLTSLF